MREREREADRESVCMCAEWRDARLQHSETETDYTTDPSENMNAEMDGFCDKRRRADSRRHKSDGSVGIGWEQGTCDGRG